LLKIFPQERYQSSWLKQSYILLVYGRGGGGWCCVCAWFEPWSGHLPAILIDVPHGVL